MSEKQGFQSDEELVRSAQQGSLDAFTILYERYLPLVYNRVRYTIPEPDVEDVTQEVFIAVLKSLRTFRLESLFSTWLRTLLNRQVVNFYRHRNPIEEQLNGDMNYPNPKSAHQTQGTVHPVEIDEAVMLRHALQQLPEQYREILLLRFAEGLRFNEIAKAHGQSLEATKSLFRRAVAALNKQVKEYDG